MLRKCKIQDGWLFVFFEISRIGSLHSAVVFRIYPFFIVGFIICAEINPLNEKLVNSTSVHCFESDQLSRPDDSKNE